MAMDRMEIDENAMTRLFKRNSPYSHLRAVQAALVDAIHEGDQEVINLIFENVKPIVELLKVYH